MAEREDLSVCQHDGCYEVYRSRGFREGELAGYAIQFGGMWNAFVRSGLGMDLRFITEEDSAERAIQRVFDNA
jgi:hypothetical protein